MVRLYITALLVSGFIGFETDSRNLEERLNYTHKQENTSITSDSMILWSPSRKLTWGDFQGISYPLSGYRATTSTILEIKINQFTDDLLDCELFAVFEKNKSWTMSKSVSLLKHEQIHFDIAELAVRKMRKKFLQHTALDQKSVQLMINDLYQEAVLERRSVNQKYDKETEHGIIASKQKEWELKIAKELKTLNAYASTRVIIKK